MLDQSFYQKADEIIAFYGKKPASLIPIMQDIQGVYRYLPDFHKEIHHKSLHFLNSRKYLPDVFHYTTQPHIFKEQTANLNIYFTWILHFVHS